MYGMKTTLNHIQPLTAYDCLVDKLIFQIDNKLIELGYGDKICFVNHDKEIISDTIVRGLLPKRFGGLESQNILVITSDNYGFDFYQCISIAKKRYGMDINKILDNTIIIRLFTIHQLTETIIYELEKLIKKFKSKLVVVISDLFLLDLQTTTISQQHKYKRQHQQQIKQAGKENKDIDWNVKQIIESLNRITNSIVVVFSSISIPNFMNYEKSTTNVIRYR